MQVFSLDGGNVRGIRDLHAFGLSIRETLKQWTGITVVVGIAPTKTLAKLANNGPRNTKAPVVLSF